MTEAFFEVADGAESLAAGSARRVPPRPGNRLEALARSPGGPVAVYLTEADAVRRWEPRTSGFDDVGSQEDPYRERIPVEIGPLRFVVRPSRVIKELRLQDLGAASSSWKPFQLTPRGFPLDVVTALGSFDGLLFVATSAGLQVYPGTRTGLTDLQAFYDLGGPGTAVRMGRPAETPDRFFILAGERCLEWVSGAPVPCRKPQALATRWLGENELWRWSSEADTRAPETSPPPRCGPFRRTGVFPTTGSWT